MKIGIRLKKENGQSDGERHIQFDIDTMRGNKHLLIANVTEEQTRNMLNTDGTPKELGMERNNQNIQQIRQWNCKMWKNLVQKLQEIHKRNLPLTE